jgi:hypothetical protein
MMKITRRKRGRDLIVVLVKVSLPKLGSRCLPQVSVSH